MSTILSEVSMRRTFCEGIGLVVAAVVVVILGLFKVRIKLWLSVQRCSPGSKGPRIKSHRSPPFWVDLGWMDGVVFLGEDGYRRVVQDVFYGVKFLCVVGNWFGYAVDFLWLGRAAGKRMS